MTAKKLAAQQTARLKQALERHDDLTCEQARDLLPALVEAELAGADVDTQPEYEALLRHLDQCEECTVLYAHLAEELSALAGLVDDLPPVRPRPQSFFTPVRESENVILRVFEGIARRFEIVLRVPQLSSTVATLNTHATLFADTLPEIENAPILSVALDASVQPTDLLVAIRETALDSRWEVQIRAGQTVRRIITDQQGIARFSAFAPADIQEITVNCIELV